MSGVKLNIRRTAHTLLPDSRRVLAKAYLPGEEIAPGGLPRAALLMQRVLKIPEPELVSLLEGVLTNFSHRHKDFEQILERSFEKVKHHGSPGTLFSRERRLLIGAYFTHEYSIEAVALFNPSLVFAPDQTNLKPSQRRFVMSLRAVGEGHISSIEFRSGTISAADDVAFDPVGPKLVGGQCTIPAHYDKGQFAADLNELGAGNRITESVLSQLPDQFSVRELERLLKALENAGSTGVLVYQTAKTMRALAVSNYVTHFPADSAIAERVIFPSGPYEWRGMEDARFVHFTDEDGSVKYYATYTAFNGFEIMPQLIETEDFVSFKISTLSGVAAQNKGMALFPRRIGGKYVMLSRRDHENLYLATSTRMRFWDDITELYRPSRPWELVQSGNCGSPLETKAGWLVLTHGVGPMRRYALSALLLDLDDPRRVIGQLPIPLIEPDETEREGYVPNVLYSCGSLINGDTLILPYGFADFGIKIALISVPELLEKLQLSGV